MIEIPRMVKIAEVIPENQRHKTFIFDQEVKAIPGQFLMVWLPDLDEKPFSMSYIGKKAGITVQEKGKFTKKLLKLKKGDSVWIRGPYGNGFSTKENAVVVAGGCGIASLAPLIEQLKNPAVIIGAKTSSELFFRKRLEKFRPNYCTDDGSFGNKGFPTELLEKELKKNKTNVVYTCGPEPMMKAVFDICEKCKVNCQSSLERYMACGFGLCGICDIDGFRVCKDGPVADSKQLKQMKSFGRSAMLKSGRKVNIKEFAAWRC